MGRPEDLILELFSELSVAIRMRNKIEPTFNYIKHIFNPNDYRLLTDKELSAWEKLTCPENYEALVRYPSDFGHKFGRQFPQSQYGLCMFKLAMNESLKRSGKTESNE